MLTEKAYEVTLTVANPINACADPEGYLRGELTRAYVGRCFKGAFIVALLRILSRSRCRINTSNTSGEGIFDVRFLAQVAVFSRGDILVGVRVTNTTPIVAGEYGDLSMVGPTVSPRAGIYMIHSEAVKTLEKGKIIPVRVLAAQHGPMQPAASVVANLFTCDRDEPPAWWVPPESPPLDTAALAPLVAAIDAEYARRAELVETHEGSLWFFEGRLYAFRRAGPAAAPEWVSVGAWRGPAPLVAVDGAADVLALAREGGAVGGRTWTRPLGLYRSSPLAAGTPEPEPPLEVPAVGATEVWLQLLREILDHAVAMRELTLTYPTIEALKSHQAVWMVMNAAQTTLPA